MFKSLFFAAILLASPAIAGPTITGDWTNPTRSVTVRIAACGGGNLCGRVVRASGEAKAKAAAGGTPRLIGTVLMSKLTPAGAGSWKGTFFVPDHNVRADGTLRQINASNIEIEGCAVAGILCKSQRWARTGGGANARRVAGH